MWESSVIVSGVKIGLWLNIVDGYNQTAFFYSIFERYDRFGRTSLVNGFSQFNACGGW